MVRALLTTILGFVPEPYRNTIAQMTRFASVGVVGLVVDGGLLYLLVRFGLHPLVARCFSFPPALATTWFLNMTWTFGAHGSGGSRLRQAAGYVAVQGVGALLNYAIYALALNLTGRSAIGSVAALAIAAVVAMFFNFTGSRVLVFRAAR
jgi:putative flippase GtrA